jgi:hypothetical protein
MRLLMTGALDPDALEACYARGLSEEPSDVQTVILASALRSGLRGFYPRLLRRAAPRKAFWDANVKLIKAAATYQPSVVWVFKGMEVFPDTLRILRDRGITLINYNPDHPFNFFSRGSGNDFIRRSIPYYHLHITYSKRIAKELKAYCPNARVAVIPFGHDVSDYVFDQISSEKEIVRACFLGSPDRHRQRQIMSLVEAGIATDVYGPRWERFLKPCSSLHLHGAVRGGAMLRTLRRYRLQLNFFRPHNADSHNMRSFEVPACGGIMLAEDSVEHRDFFENRKEAFFFASAREMIELAREILAMPGEVICQIRDAARKRCVACGYSYRTRARAALDIIKETDAARRNGSL